MTKPFYVYRILGEMGETVYIGKGTGRRLETQKRRFQSDGEIVAEFSSEAAAYKYEKRQIALHNPPLNQCQGGAGGKYGAQRCEEEKMWAGLARIIRKLKRFTEFTVLGQPISRSMIENVVASIAAKYGPDEFAKRLKPYNIEVTNRYV